MHCAVETADSPAVVCEGEFVEPNLLERKTLTKMAGRIREIVPVYHIHHDYGTLVTSGYQEMTSPSTELQSILNPPRSDTLLRGAFLQHCIMTLLLSLHV